MKGAVIALLVVLGGLGAAAEARADDVDVSALVRDGRVYVSFTLANGFNAETRAAIHSGLPTSITYDVELRRRVPIWFDRTIAAVTITVRAQYDNLTRRHQLTRSVDGRVEEARPEDSEEAVRAWMTTFGKPERQALFTTSQLEANGEYYVRVEARTRPRVTWWFFWPWDRGGASGLARFTFIP